MLNWYNRKCNIINWMPDKVKGTREAQVFAEIMACPEVKQLNTYTYMIYLMNNIDLLKEDSPGSLQVIEYLEKLYGIVPVEGSTWEERYFAILMYMRDKKEYTLRKLVNLIAELTNEKNLIEVRTNFLKNDKTYTFTKDSTITVYWHTADINYITDESTAHQFKNKYMTLSVEALANELDIDYTKRNDIVLEVTYEDEVVYGYKIEYFDDLIITSGDTYVSMDDYISIVLEDKIIQDELYYIVEKTIPKKTLIKDTLYTSFKLRDKKVKKINCFVRFEGVSRGSVEFKNFKLELGDKFTGYTKHIDYSDHYREFRAENFDVLTSIAKKEIIFRTSLDSVNKLQTLKRSLEEIVPLNFTIHIEAKLNTHGDLRIFKHNELSDKTHRQVREEDIKTWQ